MTFFKIKLLIFLVLVSFFLGQFVHAQKLETYLNAYTGFFKFRGNGSTSNSSIVAFIPSLPSEFTANPYGKESGFTYGVEIMKQFITKNKIILGLEIAYEKLESKVTINKIEGGDLVYFQTAATGNTFLKNTFITINPFVGHRYIYKKISVDMTVGTDIGFCLKSTENANASAINNGVDITFKLDIEKPLIDIRPRLQVKIKYNDYAILIGYSLGLTNYQNKYNQSAYSSFIRFGCSYQIK